MRCRSGQGDGPTNVWLGRFSLGRKPRISPSDQVVLFSSDRGSVVFWGQSTVVSVEPAESFGDIKEYTATIEPPTVFDTPRVLENLKYSLTRVWRFAVPSRHFARPYGRLRRIDANVLVNNTPYISRTVVGLLAEVLPLADRFELVTEWISQQRLTHAELANGLLAFMDSRYFGVARDLQTTVEVFSRIPVEGGALEQLAVQPETGPAIDLVTLNQEVQDVATQFGREENPFRLLLAHEAEEGLPREFQRAFRINNVELLEILQVI